LPCHKKYFLFYFPLLIFLRGQQRPANAGGIQYCLIFMDFNASKMTLLRNKYFYRFSSNIQKLFNERKNKGYEENVAGK